MEKYLFCKVCLLINCAVYIRTLPFNLNTISNNHFQNTVENDEREMLLSNNVELSHKHDLVNPTTNYINDVEVPSYMMELYKRAKIEENDNLLHNGNTVRAYLNKGKIKKPNWFFFNVSDINLNREKLLKAEFRIYKRPKRQIKNAKLFGKSPSYLQVSIVDSYSNKIISSNIIDGYSHGWKVFPITNLIKRYASVNSTNKGFFITTQHIYGSRSEFKYFTKKEKGKEPLLLAYTKDENELSLKSLTQNGDKIQDSKTSKKRNSSIIHENIFKIFQRKRRRRDIYKPRTPCQVKELSVPIDKIGWDHKIIQPRAFNINQCVGSCWSDPSKANTKQTNHAILQSLYTSVTDGQYSDYPCCAPATFKSDSALMREGETIKFITLTKLTVTSCSCL